MAQVRAILSLLLGVLSFAVVNFSPSHFILSSPFRLPIASGLTVAVSQGNNDTLHDHVGKEKYAFDFIVGSTHFVVTAAQSGTVIGVNYSSSTGCADVRCWTQANYVLIADEDGTTASLYLHLKQFIPNTNMPEVTIGERVTQGQPLGLAGATGWTTGTHLHFQAEHIPPQAAQQQQSSGWWWTQSVPVSFSNPEVLSQDSNGVPQEGQSFHVSAPTLSTHPGGLWISPQNGDTVSNTIHFAAWAYPTHPSDPAIQYVNFTIESRGSWKVACRVPSSSPLTPVPVPTPLPTSPPAPGAQIFSCDANLTQLGITPGQIQVSFDVYDIAGGFNLAPNGVHTLTYAPPSTPTPTPTTSPTLEVSPSAIDASDTSICPNGQCTMTLSSPSSNTANINWQATITVRAGSGTTQIGSVSPSSGTLAQGQTVTVVFTVSSYACGDITGSTITFTGGSSPVVVQLSGSFGPC